MELFKHTNFDFLGKKWPFIGLSLLLTLAGLVSLGMKGGPRFGIDFRGGANLYVKFNQGQRPPVDQIRAAVSNGIKGNVDVVEVNNQGDNSEVIVSVEQSNERELTEARTTMEQSLRARFPGQFQIRQTEVVGPKIGQELQGQALQATLLALAGMLVYIAFRFEFIYGLAAVLAVFHDTVITVGLFSLTDREISLTVVAALLTLIGYSMNDTIVVFDRIREMLRQSRREPFEVTVNKAINETLSRTILTSGLTFVTALALWLFGGPVLEGFAFALVVGIIVGTFSSIFIASPILIWWRDVVEKRKQAAAPAVAKAR